MQESKPTVKRFKYRIPRELASGVIFKIQCGLCDD